MARKARPPGMAGGYPEERARRVRDISVIVAGAIAVLILLAISGALGWVEALTAGIVIVTGSGAYYVGTITPPPTRKRLIDLSTDDGSGSPLEPAMIVDFLPNPALHVGSDGRIDGANVAARKMFRIDPAQNTLASAVLRDPAVLGAVERAIETGHPGRVEFNRPSAAGQVWLSHVRSTEQAGGGALVVFEDRSEIRRAEQARADFLANASHELRTPLASVAGFVETMRGPAKHDKESWDGFLDIIFEQTERMRRLIADLLSLSRIEFSEHRRPEAIQDIAALVARATQALVPIASERDIALTFNGPGGPAFAVADADEIIQAVQNLITNAVKYSPDGGHVSVELGCADDLDAAKDMAGRRRETFARMTLLDAPHRDTAAALYLRVSDEGSGIPKEHLPRLGQRFYRVDAARSVEVGGTGLGLAIVKHIMTRHRGGLIVESKEGEGSAFGIWLPARAKAVPKVPIEAGTDLGDTEQTQENALGAEVPRP
ncbi:MAG: ATP-binding protein [Pseudomonadota bacterium]